MAPMGCRISVSPINATRLGQVQVQDEDEKQEPERIPRTEPAPAEEAEDEKLRSSSEDDGEDDDEFDSFMSAQPTTDRTGILGKQRQKAMNKKGTTVSFTSASLKAHSNGR